MMVVIESICLFRFILNIDAFMLEYVRNVILADVSEPGHQAHATLQRLSYIMLTSYYVIENAAVVLCELHLVHLANVDRIVRAVGLTFDLNALSDE